LVEAIEQLRLLKDMVGPRSGPFGTNAWPSVARADQSQPRQCEIAHGTRRHADIFAKLRLDQDDHGPGKVEAGLALVGARTRHLDLASSLYESTPARGSRFSGETIQIHPRPLRFPVCADFSSKIMRLVPAFDVLFSDSAHSEASPVQTRRSRARRMPNG